MEQLFSQLQVQIRKLTELKEFHQAAQLLAQVNSKYPKWSMGWQLTAEFALQTGNLRIAENAARNAKLLEQNLKTELLLAQIALKSHDLDVLANVMTNVAEFSEELLTNDILCSELGVIAQHFGRHELALKLFTKSCRLNPNNSQHFYNQATALRFFGELVPAEDALNSAIKLNPKDSHALHLRSGLKRQTVASNHIDDLNAALNTCQVEDEIRIRYALAKEYEDLEDYQKAFAQISQACSQIKREISYSLLDSERWFTEALCEPEPKFINSESEETPIFIVGLPRTGSTLIERLLLASGELVSVDESFAFERLWKAHLSDFDESSYVKLAKQLANVNLDDTRRLVDKQPNNLYNIAKILHQIPNAKIVVTLRDPLDTCYAILKTLFNYGYTYSYSVEDCANHIKLFLDYVEQLKIRFADQIHFIRYEDVVKRPNETAKALFEYCGLEWNDLFLQFYSQKTISTTASSAQIRNPIHDRSVGIAKHLNKELLPAATLLNQYITAIENTTNP